MFSLALTFHVRLAVRNGACERPDTVSLDLEREKSVPPAHESAVTTESPACSESESRHASVSCVRCVFVYGAVRRLHGRRLSQRDSGSIQSVLYSYSSTQRDVPPVTIRLLLGHFLLRIPGPITSCYFIVYSMRMHQQQVSSVHRRGELLYMYAGTSPI